MVSAMAFSSGKGNESITLSIFRSVLVFLSSVTEGTIPVRARGTVMLLWRASRDPDNCSSREQRLDLAPHI